MFLAEFGDVKNVKLTFSGQIWIPPAPGVPPNAVKWISYDDVDIDQRRTDPMTALKVGQTAWVGFYCELTYWYPSTTSLGPVGTAHSWQPTTNKLTPYQWELTKTEDGFTLGNRHPGNDSEYDSHYLNLDFLPSEDQPSKSNPARIAIQARLSPTTNASAQMSVGFSSPVGGIGGTWPPEIRSNYRHSKQVVLQFPDLRAPAPPPPPIKLPSDLKVFFNFASARLEEVPKSGKTPNAQIDSWMTDTQTRFPEFWKAVTKTTGGNAPVTVQGFASLPGTVKANDDIADLRATNARKRLLSRISEWAVKKESYGIDRPNTPTQKAQKGQTAEEQFALITVSREFAEKAVQQFRQESGGGAANKP